MARKAYRDRHGGLPDASVVQAPAARLFFGIPNAYVGLLYYPALGVGSAFVSVPPVRLGITVATAIAALTSLRLAYDLLVVTKRSCPLCWTAHACNLCIVAVVPFMAKT